jgi:putative DNA primase/helicase
MNGKFAGVVKNADESSIALSNGKSRLSVDEAKSSLRGREIELLRWLGIAWPPQKRASHIHCPIPGHKDEDPSWRWDDSKRRWICTCGGGDIIKLVQEVEGVDFPGAMELIGGFLGRGEAQPKARPAKSGLPAVEEDETEEDPEAVLKRKRQRAFELWTEAKAIPGTLGQVYFEQHRGIVVDWAAIHNAVRFHPKLWCSEREGHFPAILFRVSASHDGETMTVHRLYLGEDGDKAKIAKPKKAYSDYKGGGVWFGKPIEGGTLVKAEGPENALVCFMADRPFVVSTIGAANLKNIEPPSTVKATLIAGDRGRGADGRKAGEDYAEDAALADKKRGFGVALTYPPARPNANGKWEDWNDLLKSDGLDAVRESLAQSEPWEDLPPGFRWREGGGGIEFLAREEKVRNDGTVEDEVWEWLCAPVEFMATTLNPDSKDWGLWLKIKTRNGIWHKAAIPKTELVTSSEDIFKHLAYQGLEFNISPRGKNKLKELLTRIRPRSYALCVPKIGFHDGVFILPNQAIGDTKGRTVVFQPTKPIEHYYRQSGSLKGWQEGVAKLARGNDRLMFAISTAFAAPLLEPVGMEGGGVHLRGSSTAGKTTILRAAGTVWGGGGQYGYIRTWRATDNALEAVAAAHNNSFLALDEIAEIEPKALFRAAYALANGRQKERMGKSIDLRSGTTWRLLFMSTGEIGMADKLSEDRMRATGGQTVRLVEIPIDAGEGRGAFRTLHGFEGPKQFAEALTAAGLKHYGHAAPAFLKHITEDLSAIVEGTKAFLARFVDQTCDKDADGQVRRVCSRFALIAAAGELAITAGIVPWSQGDARETCKRLFAEWVGARGTKGPIEVENGIAQLKAFLELHGSSRFTDWETPSAPTINRVGFRRLFDPGEAERVVYYILPEGWKEILRGFDPKLIAGALVDRGVLCQAADGNRQRLHRLPQMGPRRCYELDASLLFGDDDPLFADAKSVLNGAAPPRMV